jgi:hypothetical protein
MSNRPSGALLLAYSADSFKLSTIECRLVSISKAHPTQPRRNRFTGHERYTPGAGSSPDAESASDMRAADRLRQSGDRDRRDTRRGAECSRDYSSYCPARQVRTSQSPQSRKAEGVLLCQALAQSLLLLGKEKREDGIMRMRKRGELILHPAFVFSPHDKADLLSNERIGFSVESDTPSPAPLGGAMCYNAP